MPFLSVFLSQNSQMFMNIKFYVKAKCAGTYTHTHTHTQWQREKKRETQNSWLFSRPKLTLKLHRQHVVSMISVSKENNKQK